MLGEDGKVYMGTLYNFSLSEIISKYKEKRYTFVFLFLTDYFKCEDGSLGKY